MTANVNTAAGKSTADVTNTPRATIFGKSATHATSGMEPAGVDKPRKTLTWSNKYNCKDKMINGANQVSASEGTRRPAMSTSPFVSRIDARTRSVNAMRGTLPASAGATLNNSANDLSNC